jgi:predicted RNase H-like nuclease (RuvC/YqgF family)
MPVTTEGRVTNLSLQRQIMEFSARLDQIARDVAEIKQTLHSVEERVRTLETHEAGSHPLMDNRIDTAWQKLKEHDDRIKMLEEMMTKLVQSNRVITWLGAVLASAMLVWLVTQVMEMIAK